MMTEYLFLGELYFPLRKPCKLPSQETNQMCFWGMYGH